MDRREAGRIRDMTLTQRKVGGLIFNHAPLRKLVKQRKQQSCETFIRGTPPQIHSEPIGLLFFTNPGPENLFGQITIREDEFL